MMLKKWLKRLGPDVGADNESNRELWLEQTLRDIPAGSRILDAGAGTQRYRRYCPHLKYVSQDFAQYDGRGDSVGLQTGEFDYGKLDIVSDITQIPEPASSFDAILCSEVLEHVPDPIAAIKEFARLLQTGGRLLLTAPFCSLTHFSPYHFSTGFNRYWYEKHLTENGFRISELRSNGDYFSYLAQELRRVPMVSTKYSNKRLGLKERTTLLLARSMLARLQTRDSGSAELMCYGYHVVAIRQSGAQ